jgi:hypothetical protein
MTSRLFRLSLLISLLAAPASPAWADVCITIDSSRDTLTTAEQAAALLLVTRQFELAGERVVPAGCPNAYSVFHIRLGNVIVVTITGPAEREATAQGIDDLPALYNQMVRSIVTGRPMNALGVVDRSNVTAAQTTARRVHSDSLWYGRLGYGSIFGDRTYGTPALGFGYRAELDRFGIDVSFLNFQLRTSDSYYTDRGASAHTLLKLTGLYFLNPRSSATGYLGGGLSYGGQSFGGWSDPSSGLYTTDWDGDGLQGELTVGYELARATSLRMFVQADATLPFYEATAETYSMATPRFGPTTVSVNRRYAPSLMVSIGLGR